MTRRHLLQLAGAVPLFGEQVLDKTVEIGGNLKDIGRIVKDAVAEKFAEFGNGVVGYGREGKDQVLRLRDGAATYVEGRPLKAVLVASGIGLLLGMLLRRK